jgi:hypothetical protein
LRGFASFLYNTLAGKESQGSNEKEPTPLTAEHHALSACGKTPATNIFRISSAV